MANKRLNDLPEETDPGSDDVVAIDGATTRKATRANLLGSNIEAIRGLTSAADKGIQFTGSGMAATYPLTSAGKALLDDTDASAQRATLGLVIGTDVQAHSDNLDDFSGKTAPTGDVVGTTDAQDLTNKTLNKVTITAPATGSTLTIVDGKTLQVNASLTLTGQDGKSLALDNSFEFATVGSVDNTVQTFPGSNGMVVTSATTAGGSLSGSYPNPTIAATAVTSSTLNADVFSTAHSWSGQQTFTAPALGTPASGVATNLTGTASGLTAGNVTTNANLTGDVTSVGNASTIAANAVTNAKMATMAAYTLKGNATGSSAVPTDIDVTALAVKASPVSADIVLIQDSAAANAFKKTTVGALASAGSVASIGTETGALTISFGQAALVKSGSNIVLSPRRGNIITINGANKRIPNAGVSLAPTGLTVGTLYYIYAYMNSGTMTLEASTTGHSTSSTSGNEGVEIKTGDDTRTLVGMVRPITGPAFADTAAQRFVRSWFNEKGISTQVAFATTPTTTSTTAVEISSTIRNEFLIWSDEIADFSEAGTVYNATANQATYSNIAFDGTVEAPQGGGGSAVSNQDIMTGERVVKSGLSEGYHYATIFGKVSGGTGTWYGTVNHLLSGSLYRSGR